MISGGLNLILASGVAPAIIHNEAYANTLTGIIPDIYAGMDMISRELTGFITGAMRAPGVERAAVGQSVVYPISVAKGAVDIVPAMQIPEPTDSTVTTGSMAITKARAVEFGFTGEEQRALNTGGVGLLTVQGMWVAEAIRTLTNEVEADLAAEAAANASRAYGTAGDTPFDPDVTTIRDTAQLRKILDDNGAPQFGRSLILNTSAGANMRSKSNLTRVNEAGSTMTLRQGELLDLHGFSIKESAQSVTHTAGSAAAATTNAAGYAVGATVIGLAAAGTGAFVAGDVVSFAGDANKYVIVPNGGDANVTDGGSITIAAPGLRVAIPAAATAITKAATYSANVGFSANALHVAMRPPATPVEGDARIDSRLFVDPRSGIAYEMSIWPGYRKVRAEVALAWGVKAVKREHIALLLG